MKDKEDDEIIATAAHSYSYVDGDYFQNVMGEDLKDPSYLTFPVQVQAIRADWILDDSQEVGLEFLRALQKCKSRAVFSTPYISILI